MAVKMGIYKCMKCGNVVEVVVQGGAPLVCCGEEMKLMDEKNKEGAGEKHVPVVEAAGKGILVKVGSVPHPMDADHWIQFIEVLTKDGLVLRRDLNPGGKPEAVFPVEQASVAAVREFCNKHGLWSK
jgi:superoxide reductase